MDELKLYKFDYELDEVLKTLDEIDKNKKIETISDDLDIRLKPFEMALLNKLYNDMNKDLKDYDYAGLVIYDTKYNKYGAKEKFPCFERYYDLKDMRNIVDIKHADLLAFRISYSEIIGTI